MNYLGHFFLSGINKDLLVGNFIADAVKGKQYLNYSSEVAKGILLHRAIDSFTDSHSQVKSAIELFRPIYGRYAGVFVDVLYDYLLCINWNEFSSQSRKAFIEEKMNVLAANFFSFPFKIQQFFPLMKMNGWLYRYETLDGIDQVMLGMSRHTSFPIYSSEMKSIVNQNVEMLSSDFRLFFAEIIAMTEDFILREENWMPKLSKSI